MMNQFNIFYLIVERFKRQIECPGEIDFFKRDSFVTKFGLIILLKMGTVVMVSTLTIYSLLSSWASMRSAMLLQTLTTMTTIIITIITKMILEVLLERHK